MHPASLEEAEAATEWYRLRSVRAAEMFMDELDRAIERIGDHPGQFPEYAFGARRVVLQRFPYLTVFRETAAGVEILAVAHGRRRRDRVE
ncbi:MAG: type II toxin-antitoxin system RelE/ParE family toxin [Bryobacteraceae bacterium]